MEQFEKVCKGLQTAVDSDWMWRKADYIAMCCKDALALIRQQQERIKELEAAQTARVMTLEEVKTQEPIEPIKHLSTGQICGSCKKVLLRKYKYCPACGKAVKWE